MATIELILTEDIHRLGNAGDVVRVKAGFGRNYLLPQGKAMLATAGRVKQVEHQRRVIDELQKKAVAGYQDLARRVLAVDLTFETEGRNEILVLSELYRGLQGEIATARVTGKLSDPQLNYQSLSGTRRILGVILGEPDPKSRGR